MTGEGRRLGAVRVGLLVVPLMLGLALAVTAWRSLSDAHALVPMLARGQSESYLRTLRESLRPPAPPSPGALSALLERYSADGLRYVAILDANQRVALESGSTTFGDESLPRPHELQWRAERVRVLTPPPPPSPPPPPIGHTVNGVPWMPPPAPPGAPPFPPGPDDLQQLHPMDNTVVMEFVPVAAVHLLDRARMTTAFSVAVSMVLMVAAGLLWRQLRRAEAAERELEKQRHMAYLGEMSAVLAHEIRNPLAATKGHAQLLAEKIRPGEPSRPQVEQVVAHVERLERLASQLLDFARADAVQSTPSSPEELVRDVILSCEPERISLDVDECPESWPLDPVRMRQVLVNVIQNALQSGPRDTSVDVKLTELEGRLLITVRDHGPGVAAGQEDAIFEPFHTARVRGTGLGLAVARKIVSAHGGSIRVEHPDGGGARFVISIPQVRSSHG